MAFSQTHHRPTARSPHPLFTRLNTLVQRMVGARPSIGITTVVRTGQAAPTFALASLDGISVTLGALLAPTRPVLLIFVDPQCSVCHELLPDIGGWQQDYGDRLAIALVSTGDLETNRVMMEGSGTQRVLVQNVRELTDAFGLVMSPAAVLIQPDGLVGSEPQYGPQAIWELMASTLGKELPQTLNTQAVQRGDPAPPLHQQAIDGRTIDLAAFKGEPLLLLFWSPGCGHCQELLPHILAFERLPDRVPLVVISRGSVEVNQELGFASPVILDDDRAIFQLFAIRATPAAVLIGSHGNISSAVAHGAAAVHRLVDTCHAPDSTSPPN